MKEKPVRQQFSRRRILSGAAQTAAVSVGLAPVLRSTILSCAAAQDAPALKGIAGIDRVVILPGKTYLRGWAGYGEPRKPLTSGPAPAITWEKDSGPGKVTFADPKALITTATFSTPGAYVLKLTADNGQSQSRFDAECPGRDSASGQAARRRLHEELQDQQPALERARQGADRQLDSALHRPDQPHRHRSRAPAASTTSSRRARSCAASRTAATRATCSPTPGSTRRSSRCASR